MVGAYKIEFQLSAQGLEIPPLNLLTADLTETMYKGSQYCLELLSKDTSLWNKIASAACTQRLTGTLRWGYSTGAGDAWCKSPRTFFVSKCKINSQSNVVRVSITGCDGMFALQNRASRKAYKQKTLVAIAKEIATDNGLRFEGDVTGRAFPLLMQCGMTDYKFLQEVVLARSGPVPAVLYCKNGNTLVFKQRKASSPAFSVGYGASADVSISSMVSVIALDDSNYGVSVSGFDATKRDANALAPEYLANDETKPYDQFGGTKPSAFSDVPGRIQNITVNELGPKVEDILRQRADFAPSFSMCRSYARSSLLLNPELGDTVEVRGKTALNEDLFFTGKHQLFSLYHHICPGQESYSYVFLERRGVVNAG